MDVGDLIERMLGGDRVALAKLITLVENRDRETRRIMSAVFDRAGKAYVVARCRQVDARRPADRASPKERPLGRRGRGRSVESVQRRRRAR
jgi:hypothetical protein